MTKKNNKSEIGLPKVFQYADSRLNMHDPDYSNEPKDGFNIPGYFLNMDQVEIVLDALGMLDSVMRSYYNLMPSRNGQNIRDIELSTKAIKIMKG